MNPLHNVQVVWNATLRENEATELESLFVRGFSILKTRSALREGDSLSDFARMIRDPRVEVYVVNDSAGPTPIGVGLLARDLAAVPWVSTTFFAHRWPDAYAQGRLCYVPFVVIDPAWQGRGPAAQLLAAMIDRVASERAVVGFDVSAFNEGGRGFVRAIQGTLEEAHCDYDLAPVDQHTFYAATFDGTPAGGLNRR